MKADARTCDLNMWHRILGNCNKRDVVNLEKVVTGMKIEGATQFKNETCETCILGKSLRDFNRNPDERATKPMEFAHADLRGPITPVARDGFRYVLGFVDMTIQTRRLHTC